MYGEKTIEVYRITLNGLMAPHSGKLAHLAFYGFREEGEDTRTVAMHAMMGRIARTIMGASGYTPAFIEWATAIADYDLYRYLHCMIVDTIPHDKTLYDETIANDCESRFYTRIDAIATLTHLDDDTADKEEGQYVVYAATMEGSDWAWYAWQDKAYVRGKLETFLRGRVTRSILATEPETSANREGMVEWQALLDTQKIQVEVLAHCDLDKLAVIYNRTTGAHHQSSGLKRFKRTLRTSLLKGV